jgi:predicted transposase/invertase (TIGR01784 family)
MTPNIDIERLINTTFINPLTDFGFRKLFQDKKRLAHFLSDILGGSRVAAVEYLPTNLLGDFKEERSAVFDIYCTNAKGEHFIVEMQHVKQEFFADRAIFYTSFPIRNQAPKGSRWNYQLVPVYFIGIMNFVLFDEPEAAGTYLERVHLWREEVRRQFSDKLNFVFVELPKFTKAAAELKTNVDFWLYSLKNMVTLSRQPTTIKGEIFTDVYESCKSKRLTTTEMKTYKSSVLESYSIRNAIEYNSRLAYGKGYEQARAESAAVLAENAALKQRLAKYE